VEKQDGLAGLVAHVGEQAVLVAVFELWRENIGSAAKRPDQDGGPGQGLIFGSGVMVDIFDLTGLDQVGGFPIGAGTFESKDGVDGGIDGGVPLAVVDTARRERAKRGGYAGDHMLIGEDVGDGG
jgi:hypothetical protein